LPRRIYLDFNASTPLAAECVQAMRPFLCEHFGNPSSAHWAGAPAKNALEDSRAAVAEMLACSPAEIVFTSGGSEANNHALKGVFYAHPSQETHIITTQIEHPAVLNPCSFLERLGASVTYVPVDASGRVDPDAVRRAIRPQTALISVMHANNEVGTIQPLQEIGRVAREHGVLFHSDAAQTCGKIGTSVDDLGVDLLSVAGHKLYAPKGIGALFIRAGVRLEPLVHGAGHESGRRAGTENVMLAAALAAASRLAISSVGDARVCELRDLFWMLLQDRFGDGVVLNGHAAERLPNTLNVSFVGKVGSEILARMPNVAASTGSACHAGSLEMSPVLKAMGTPREIGLGAIRFSLGRTTTRDEIEEVASAIEI